MTRLSGSLFIRQEKDLKQAAKEIKKASLL